MITDNNELNLIRKAQKGDERAIDELYTKYKHYVASICHKYYLIGGDEDDLMQEGMLGFFKAINTFDFDNHEFLPYAKTLIHNQIVNAIKRASSGKAGFLNESIQLNNQGEIVVEEKNKVKRAFIQFLQTDIEMLAESESDAETKAALSKLAEKVRFSDPMSHEMLGELESRISTKVEEMKTTAYKKALISEIEILLIERNKKCKILKG